jgi:TolA-binding protein
MSARLSMLALVVLTLGCDSPIRGVRYRAERDLWQSNREARRLSIRPQLVTDADWRALAARYERIAARYGEVPAPANQAGQAARAAHEIRLVAARAWISAAQVHTVRGDSTRMLRAYERVASGFQDVPIMTAEVALARGRIAESKGDTPSAIASYRAVVDQIEPLPGEAGVAGAVMDLPLQIARLHARDRSQTPQSLAAIYDTARIRYERWVAARPGTLVEFDARERIADLAADRGQWSAAATALQLLEARLVASGTQGRDPARVRYALAAVLDRAQPGSDASRETLLGLLADYPQSPLAPQALLALGADAARRGRLQEALGYVDRMRSEHLGGSELDAQSLLQRGRLLEQQGRWSDALATFKALPVDQPMSEPALQAPLEIVRHYASVKDEPAMRDALVSAEQHYRDFIRRYPPGPYSVSAQAKLVSTLILQERPDAAISELVDMGESMTGSPQGARFMIDAARLAFRDMDDSTRAVEILERAGKLYPNSEIGRWASAEAVRLREGNAP